MDPAKRASLGARSEVREDAQLEEQVKDWLRYGEDLGLAPYYRDRPPLHAIAASRLCASGIAQCRNVEQDLLNCAAAIPVSNGRCSPRPRARRS